MWDGDWSVELNLHPDPERGVGFLSEAKFLTVGRKAEEDLLVKASKYAKLKYLIAFCPCSRAAIRGHPSSYYTGGGSPGNGTSRSSGWSREGLDDEMNQVLRPLPRPPSRGGPRLLVAGLVTPQHCGSMPRSRPSSQESGNRRHR